MDLDAVIQKAAENIVLAAYIKSEQCAQTDDAALQQLAQTVKDRLDVRLLCEEISEFSSDIFSNN